MRANGCSERLIKNVVKFKLDERDAGVQANIGKGL